MHVRKPAVAGQFYPADRNACIAEILECVESAPQRNDLPASIVAGIVPHAGWTFSGALAAAVFASVRQQRQSVETFVVCGAAHRYMGASALLDGADAWRTPLGQAEIDADLRDRLSDIEDVTVDSSAHQCEHSIEVQIPLIQHFFPEARILPVIVPPNQAALAFGDALAKTLLEQHANAIVIGSTDLTHYGPGYGFTPMGSGANGLTWASEVNDREFIDLALDLKAERVLSNAIQKSNACGPGAAAATLVVARELGVQTGLLIGHTTSNDIMQRKMAVTSRDSVGYAAIVF